MEQETQQNAGVKRTQIALARPALKFAALLALVAASSAMAAETWSRWENSFARHDAWRSMKSELVRTTGSRPFVFQPQTVYGNRLNLGAWLGFHEVWFQHFLPAARVQFQFELDEDAYLAMLYESEDGRRGGVRVSRHAAFNHTLFSLLPDGKFENLRPLQQDAPLGPGMHYAELATQNAKTTFFIDGAPWAQLPLDTSRLWRLGFRGSCRNASVDEIQFHDATGAAIRCESFRNDGWPDRFLVVSTAQLLFLALAGGLLRLCARPRRESLNILLSAAWGASFLIPAVCAHFWLESKHYPTQLETLESNFLKQIRQNRVERMAAAYTPQPEEGVLRIVFLGSSQTYGAGANGIDECYVAQLEKLLNTRLESGPVECMNAGMSGRRSAELVELYETIWKHYGALICVVDLSHNDGTDEASFVKSLDRLANLNKELGVETIFVLEPNSIEGNPGDLFLHPAMRRVAGKHGIPVVEAHATLKERHGEGFQWWDLVHPTSFGHAQLAEAIYPVLAQHVQALRQEQAAHQPMR
ncbi:MAG: SGNH/GDSL hydrolase family protein [Candidatus Hydrogenedentes bacterium]|nr:SGNH/GDSL hydrolase family protein [Candidatus Hydrogenedentota bacterium]